MVGYQDNPFRCDEEEYMKHYDGKSCPKGQFNRAIAASGPVTKNNAKKI